VNTEAFPSIVSGIGTLGLKGDAWFTEDTVVMCAAGTMPGELHKLWKATRPMSYKSGQSTI
jgi:TPP-dependent trihydroxycyclohexane-1,2-dione (THcHDO) dehydratase